MSTFANIWQLLTTSPISRNFWQLLLAFANFVNICQKIQQLGTFVNLYQLLVTFGKFRQHWPTFANVYQLLPNVYNFCQLVPTMILSPGHPWSLVILFFFVILSVWQLVNLLPCDLLSFSTFQLAMHILELASLF